MIIGNVGNQKTMILFFKKYVPGSSVIGFVKEIKHSPFYKTFWSSLMWIL